MNHTNRLNRLWNGPVGRFLDGWNKHQRWWWFSIILGMTMWFSYDIGQLVARADLLSGSNNVQGSITVAEAVEKSQQHHGGRLIIISDQSARLIDASGLSWNIPDFVKNTTKAQLETLEKNDVTIDGSYSIIVRPIKTRPSDLIMTTLSDFFLKIIIIGFYLLVLYLGMRYMQNTNKGRYKKVGTDGHHVTTTITDVAGYEGVKNELLEVVDYLKDPERFAALGARPPRGVLLYGPPGNGKTLMAKALAGEARASFFEQSASSFVQIYAGEGAKSVRHLFEQARKSIPAVIFIDEIDAVGELRSSGSHDERVQTLNAILTEMDGFANNEGLVVVAATNRIDTLDPALVRPGRFDRKVWVGMPSWKDRLQILQVHATHIKAAADVDWSHWSTQTQGLSGADLSALVNEAAIEAARARAPAVNNAHLALARDRVWIGAKNHGQVLSDHERHIIAVHELGHAWMQLSTGGQVEKVSIAPRGQSLGVTVSVAPPDKIIQTKTDIHNQLLVLMGGRAAEQVMFGQVSGGALDDMKRASALARDAVVRLGSTTWGAYIPEDTQNENLDQAASALVNDALQQAIATITTAKAHLHDAATLLVQTEEMSGLQLQNLWNIATNQPTITAPKP